MRNLSLLGCVVALTLSSGCQSGSSGFRNPFKDQFAGTFPKSFPELLTTSKERADENRGEFHIGDGGSSQSTELSGASMQSVSDSPGSSDLRSGGQRSEVDEIRKQADAAFAAGNLPEAAGLYQASLQLNPQDVHAHHRLAIIYDKQQDYATAEHQYEAALRLQPDNVSVLNNLGYSYYLQQRYEDSKAYFEYILQIDRENQLAMRNLALVHAAEGDVQQAYALFQQGGLNPEQSQQKIQQAVARASEGKASTRHGRMGVASMQTESMQTEQPRVTPEEGVATVGTSSVNPDSAPGRTEIRSPQGDAFQPRPDWDSSYGLNTDQLPGYPERSNQTGRPASPSPVYRPDPTSAHSAVVQQQHEMNSAVERVAYSSPALQQVPSATDAEMIRTALNLGYGNLFPLVSPEDSYRLQRATTNLGTREGENARHAYYEQFGQPESRTPHVVHAIENRPDQESAARVRNAGPVTRRVSYNGSSRIQSPSYESGRPAGATQAAPANAFPVTESPRDNSATPDFSQFPKQEQPPFVESPAGDHTQGHAGPGTSGMLIEPDYNRPPVEQKAFMNPDQNAYNDPVLTEPQPESYGPQVSPMSEPARKAHELALERYRQMQQQ